MGQPHILIVESEKIISRILKETLLSEGYAVETAYDGEEALELLSNPQPDLIVLDLMLPGIDGYEVIRRVRTRPESIYISIIVISSFGDATDMVRAFEIGADDYIVKPFQIGELFARIKVRVRIQLELARSQRTHLPNTIMQPADKERTGAINIFICYAHKDKTLLDKLENHLEPLRRSGQIMPWYDREIQPGMNWKQEIDTHLNSADIILLLISPDFMASDYCYGKETVRALERHERGEAHVIPVILRPADWKETPIGLLQALPAEGRPVTRWRNRDEAFENIASGLRKVFGSILSQKLKRNP